MKTSATLFVLLCSSAAFAQGGGRFGSGGPKVGDEAPNFTAKVLGEKTEVELKKVLEKEQKPIVLIFGSYT